MNALTHLHIHSEFSLSDSILRVGEIVDFAKSQGAEAIALTDRNNLYGALKFYKKARAAGIKPILGCDLTVRDSDGTDNQLILLAQNLKGFIHLCELVSFAYQYDQDHQGVAVHIERFTPTQCEGLIALSGGIDGDLARFLRRRDAQGAEKRAAFWQGIFPDRYYLQLARHGQPGEAEYFDWCRDAGRKLGIAAVATNLACFPTADDYDVHEVRVCISNGWLRADDKRPRYFTQKYHFTSDAVMAERFADAPQILANTHAVAARCNLELTLGKNYLPDFPLPEGVAIEDFLVQSAKDGLELRLAQLFPDESERAAKRAPYDERLAIELGVINQMGFPGYFLIVADFIQWAKDHDIPVGPGRGSGAGSLVAYALKITDLDPLAYDLFFERFLNPERVSMPDFDVDFCMERRDEVIEYVSHKYGAQRVSQIATHGTMAAKAVLRDVGRVLGVPYPVVDKLVATVPPVLGITLPDALGRSAKSQDKPELRSEAMQELYEKDEEMRDIIDIGLQLEGLARNVGKHAGGVVIAPTKLTDFSALYSESAGAGIATQFDKDDIEAMGLVKFDFLGLRTLTVIDWALGHINTRRAREGQPPLDIATLPLDDPQTYALLQSTRTTAVFQLESSGMKELIRKLRPDTFEDIIALVALFRPGPLGSGMVDDFINRKHGLAEVEYPHPDLEGILQTTYGVMVYQEQVMQVAQKLANYSLGEADNLRRAMGKKKAEEMARNKDIFVSRAVERGVPEKQATDIFDLMAKFAEYGFNKSHSAAYALLSYQTAWLKAHYPAELMAAVLTSEIEKIDKIVRFINEARDMGLTVIPPCINRSQYTFTVSERGEIIYGLGAVKGVGEAAINILLEERAKNGDYTSLEDLCRRLDLKKLNRKTLETLIRAGSFDNIEPNRGALFAAVEQAIKLAEQHHRNRHQGQGDMFGLFGDSSRDQPPSLIMNPEEAWDLRQTLAEEKQTLGLFLSAHPIDEARDPLLQISRGRNLAQLQENMENWQRPTRRGDSIDVTLAGVVIEARSMVSKKNGNPMIFITLDDRSGRQEIGVFGKAAEEYKDLCKADNILIIHGKADYNYYKEEWRINAETIHDYYDARYSLLQKLDFTVNAEALADNIWQTLQETLAPLEDTHGARISITLQNTSINAQGRLHLPATYRIDHDNLRRLEHLLAEPQIRRHY